MSENELALARHSVSPSGVAERGAGVTSFTTRFKTAEGGAAVIPAGAWRPPDRHDRTGAELRAGVAAADPASASGGRAAAIPTGAWRPPDRHDRTGAELGAGVAAAVPRKIGAPGAPIGAPGFDAAAGGDGGDGG